LADAGPATTEVLASYAADVTFVAAPTDAIRSVWRRNTRDPLLAPNAKRIAEHFGPAANGVLDVQRIALAGDRTALMISGPADHLSPVLLVVDAKGNLLWSKDRPVAGVSPPVTAVTLAPGPQSGVAIFFFDAPTGVLASRMWDGDGGLLVDFSLLTIEACTALSAMYWPHRGWVVAASFSGGARAQLLTDNGVNSWSNDGLLLPAADAGPVSLVLDTPDSVMMFERGKLVGSSATGDRVLAFRYDPRGIALWNAPLEVGRARAGEAKSRIEVARLREGVARVPEVIDEKGRAASVEVMSSGQLRR
jgi:hypothetical protein